MEPSHTQPPCINWDAALEHTGDDADLLDDLVGTFMEEGPMRIQEVHDGLESKDAVLVHRAAHTLKSSFLLFGAIRGAEVAAEILELGKSSHFDGIPSLLSELEAFMERMMIELKDRLER